MGEPINLVLAGGGVKGISYIGVFEVMEKNNQILGNVSGVSAGALAGALAVAGFRAREMKEILYNFDFDKVNLNKIPQKIPIIQRTINYTGMAREMEQLSIHQYLSSQLMNQTSMERSHNLNTRTERGAFFKNLITLSKEGCLFNGDYLEEWAASVLKKKGIKTFGDLKTGEKGSLNPKGYRIRMTAVDATRGKILILPDDIIFYGMEPDQLDVAKAIRMSTSVPFAFQPVELKKTESGKMKSYHIVDGGVMDNMPSWLADHHSHGITIGVRFMDNHKSKLLSINTPLNVLNYLISLIHHTGIPKQDQKLKNIIEINTSKVPALDFNLKDEEKNIFI